MNRELLNKKLKPHSAIIVYTSGGQYSSEYYLETREIFRNGQGYDFAAPVPMSDDKMKDIAAAYIKKASSEMAFEGIIPDHMLYAHHKAGNTVIFWWRKSEKRTLNFAEPLRIKGNPSVIIPATLYVIQNTTLYVFALMDDERPKRATKLYNAPFFNIYEGGNVCLGTAPIGKYKAKTFDAEAERFERGFYMAEQNNGMHSPCKTKLSVLWNGLIKKKARAFPAKQELIQHKKYPTMGDLMDKLIGKNQNRPNYGNFEEEEDD